LVGRILVVPIDEGADIGFELPDKGMNPALKIAAGKKCGGRKSYAEARPEMVELARQLRQQLRPRVPRE
jgi:hypothetical protein